MLSMPRACSYLGTESEAVMLTNSIFLVLGDYHAMGFGGLVGAAADGANLLVIVFVTVLSLLMIAPDVRT
jgi:uncharacterized membrane protein YtjA (UPF0391 family)